MISQKMQQFVQNSSVIRAMFEEGKKLSAQYGAENVFDFSIGNPSIEPPAAVSRAVVEILMQEQPLAVHGYMNNSGYEEVRAAIAEHLNCLHRASLTAEQIVMTCGAAGGLNIVLKALLNPGDEVIVFAPFFGEYANYVDNFDGKLVVVPTIPDTFLPNLSALESAVSEKTKAVIINTPNNPTGVIYSDILLKDLCAVLEKKQREYHIDIYLISDEPYRELVYDGAAVPFLFDFFQNAVIVYSYSKTLSLPGERIGYLAVHPDSADGETLLSALNVANRILGFVNAPSLFQKTVAKILDSSVDVSAYRENRDLLYMADAMVIDVGGTTTDLGVLSSGFPRESGVAVTIGGVRTNFRMPDVVSIGLGGGSIVREREDGTVSVGPDSVGYRITEKALVFGGDTMTATDVAVRLGMAKVGDPALAAGIDEGLAQRALAAMRSMVEEAIDMMKVSSDDIDAVLVGGGSIILPVDLAGTSRVDKPEHSGCANAIGSAISKVSGTYEALIDYDATPREEALAAARQAAIDAAVAAGAIRETVEIVDVEDVPLQYYPGRTNRVKVKAAGNLFE